MLATRRQRQDPVTVGAFLHAAGAFPAAAARDTCLVGAWAAGSLWQIGTVRI